MRLLMHLWEVILFVIILVGPIPGCLSISLIGRNRHLPTFTLLLFLVLIVWSLIQITFGLFLGIFHSLNLHTVVSLETLFLLIGLFTLSKLQDLPLKLIFKQIVSFKFNLSRIEASILGSLILKLIFKQIVSFKFNLSRIEASILGSLILVGLVLVRTSTIEPSTDFDSLWFHLPAITRWYQTGSFTLLDTPGNLIFEHPDAELYPYNWHVLSVLFILPFHEDFLVTLPSLIAWILLGLSVCLLSIEFGATRLHSLAGASLVLTMPMLLTHVNTVRADLPLAAFFTVSLLLAILYHKSRRPIELGLFLACLGMLAGIKTPGIIYSSFLATILILLELKRYFFYKRSTSFKKLVKPSFYWVVFGTAICLFLGCFWYVRNLNELHNQLASISAIQVASINLSMPSASKFDTLAQGIHKLQQTTLTNQFNPANLAHWQMVSIQAIVRLQLPFLAMLLQVILLPIALVNGQNRIKKITLVFLSALLLLTAFLYWNTPYSSGSNGYISGELNPLLGNNMRYGYPFLGMLGVVAATCATAFNISDKVIAALVTISSILGVISTSIFNLSNQRNFTGGNIVWASALLNDTDSPFGKTISYLAKLLMHGSVGSSLLELLVLIGLFALTASAKSYLPWKQISFNLSGGKSLFIILSLCIGLAATTWIAREQRDVKRAELYRGIYEYLDQNVKAGKIAYFSSFRSYLFYGKNLDKQVVHVPFRVEQPNEWLKELHQSGVSWVATGPSSLNKEKKDVLSQLVNQGSLELVFGRDAKNELVLYRLLTTDDQHGKPRERDNLRPFIPQQVS